MKTQIRQPFAVIILLICLVVILAKLADWGALGVDSSVFAAVGQHINQYGSVIYRDVWDHKFPGIFFINAAIFRLLPEVPYSIQLFEMAYGCLTSIAFYGLLRQLIDRPSLQVCGTLAFAFFSNLHLLTEGGNLTENYMLLPLVLVWLWVTEYVHYRQKWQIFLAGVAAGCLLLIKPTGIYTLVAVGVFLAVNIHAKFVKPLLFGALGAAIPLACFGIYLIANDAFPAFFDAAINYNRAYLYRPDDTFSSSLLFWESTVRFIAYTALLILPALAAIVLSLWTRTQRIRVAFVVFWFVLDSIAIFSGMKFYRHYYLQTVPALVVLAVIGINLFAEVIGKAKPPIRFGGYIIAFVSMIALLVVPIGNQVRAIGLAFSPQALTIDQVLGQYVANSTQPDEKVAMLGGATRFWFESKRQSSGRYLYDFALWWQPFRLAEFIDKIIRECPSIILISPQTPLDRIELQSLWVFISQEYTQSKIIQGWIIYRRNN